MSKNPSIPHDEALKKLLQTFFLEFMELFFPEVRKLMDPAHTRLLMQEQLVDIVGEEVRNLDLLIETRMTGTEAYILVHLEPQSYRERDFHERMFIYFSRLFERHRKEHRLIVPVAIFTFSEAAGEPDTLCMSIPSHDILRFSFLKVELRQCDWRAFIDSDNPIAAALLAKMGYNKQERRQVRTAFLRMLLRLRSRLDDARVALVISVADLYFDPKPEEDREIMTELLKEFPKEGEAVMELMPAWKRWGYEEGIAEGLEKGREEGREEGKLAGKKDIASKLLAKGLDAAEVAEITELSLQEVEKLARP